MLPKNDQHRDKILLRKETYTGRISRTQLVLAKNDQHNDKFYFERKEYTGKEGIYGL